MIIVNQDKDLIVNFNNITVVGFAKNNSKEIRSKTTNGDEQCLGKYKTEERAKEVLQNIKEAYAPRKPQSLAELANYRQMAKYEMPED